jgi:hypothetical protein
VLSTGLTPGPLRTNGDRSAEFRDVLIEADAREEIPQAAAERNNSAFVGLHVIAENIAHFLLEAVPMTICLTLKPSFEVFF